MCILLLRSFVFFFFNDTATTEIYTLSLHDALPIYKDRVVGRREVRLIAAGGRFHRAAPESSLIHPVGIPTVRPRGECQQHDAHRHGNSVSVFAAALRQALR